MEILLKDIAEITAGQSPESKYYSFETGTPFLQGNRTFGIKYPTIDTFTTKITKMAKKGEVLMSVRAPVGDLNIANCDVCIGRGLIALKAKDGDNEFLYYLLKSNLKNIVNKSNGTTYDSITMDIVQNIKLNIPTGDKNKISKILSSIDDQIQRNNDMVQKLQSFDTTLSCFFKKGEIRYAS